MDVASGERHARALALAKSRHLPIHSDSANDPGYNLALAETGTRLELRVLQGDRTLIGGHGVASELTSIDTSSGPGRSLGQPLIKAVGIKRRNPYRPTVFDATAGLGEDAWVLASFGCRVTACERHPVTHTLLTDGLQRAALTHPQTVQRINTLNADSIDSLADLSDKTAEVRPDVVYLDPMFPAGRKTTERKAMRVLRLLAGDDPDADRLLDPAMKAAVRRVVVKRPLHAEALKGPAPIVVHKGKSLRFDVYVTC